MVQPESHDMNIIFIRRRDTANSDPLLGCMIIRDITGLLRTYTLLDRVTKTQIHVLCFAAVKAL